MKTKTLLLTGAVVGYVIGTRDGRERYEQIKASAQRFWNDPKVRDARRHAQDTAKAKAPEVQHQVSEAAAKAAAAARSTVHGDPAQADATGAAQPGETTRGATYG